MAKKYANKITRDVIDCARLVCAYRICNAGEGGLPCGDCSVCDLTAAIARFDSYYNRFDVKKDAVKK